MAFELRSLLLLFVRERSLIFIVVLIALGVGSLGYRLQGQRYDTELLLSVTRGSAETTTEYRYDEFYRLQADERVADTLTQFWLSRSGEDLVAERAGFGSEQRKKFLLHGPKVNRLSSQLIRITFSTETISDGQKIANALTETGEAYLETLNHEAKEPNWFRLVSTPVLTEDGRFPLGLALLLSGSVGLFLSWWIILFRWYWRGMRKMEY